MEGNKISLKEAIQKYGLKLNAHPINWRVERMTNAKIAEIKNCKIETSYWFYSQHTQKYLLDVQNILLNNIDCDYRHQYDGCYLSAFIHEFLVKNFNALKECAKKIVEVRLQEDLLKRGVNYLSIDSKLYDVLKDREIKQLKVPEEIKDKDDLNFYEKMIDDMMTGAYTKREYHVIWAALTGAGLCADARPVEIEIIEDIKDKKTDKPIKACCSWDYDEDICFKEGLEAAAKELFGDEKPKKTRKSGGK